MMQMKAASSVKKELVRQPGNTPMATRRRLTRRHWPTKLQREVASSVKQEPAVGTKVKRERIDERKAMNSNGDPWLQVRDRLEEMIRGANLHTPVKEEMFLAKVTQQVEKQIQDTADKQKAAKAMKAVQFNVLSGTWKELDLHSAQSEDASVASAAKPAPPAEWPKPTQFRRNNLVKQSGVPHVSWNTPMVAWQVHYPTFDSKGKKNGSTGRYFAVKKFLVPGRSEAEADAEALEAAKAFRAELVQQGILSEPKPQDPNFTSEVPGVLWDTHMQKWRVRIRQKGSKKYISGGYFTEKAAAEAKALQLREKHGLQRQVRPVSTLAELPVFCPKVPYPGVKWRQAEQQWHAFCQVDGATRNFRNRPKDHSEEELERSFKKARAWKKKQEKERAKPKKSKVGLVKKPCKNLK
eukprot:Skav235796  [mRNA]  locus=scaffold1267:107125:108351:+ [translate_table: standard]